MAALCSFTIVLVALQDLCEEGHRAFSGELSLLQWITSDAGFEKYLLWVSSPTGTTHLREEFHSEVA